MGAPAKMCHLNSAREAAFEARLRSAYQAESMMP